MRVRAARLRAMRRLARRAWGRLVARAAFHEWDEGGVLLAFGVAIGVAVGLSVVVFYRLVDLAYLAFAELPQRRLDLLANALYRPLLTAAGLWTAWLIVRRLRLPEGQTVPDVQLAVAKRGGDVPLRPVAGRTLAAAVTLGAGGSAGSEGPVAVLGSALGSTLGKLFRFEARHRKILVGCGAAAGIAGAFGAPFAGAFFALEEVLGSFSVGAFSPVVIASVVGAITTRAFLGDVPVVDVPAYGSVPLLVLLLLYPLLGVACGVVSAFYVRMFFGAQDLAARLRGPAWLRPLAAGALVGALALSAASLVSGHGHLRIPIGELAPLAWWALLGLALAKMVMTSVTLAGGGSGGVFTPTLFIGAALGAGLGALVVQLLPGIGASPVRWGLVGMAGLVAGATRAPITAIFMVFEITDDYGLVLPLMLVSVLAYATSRRLAPHGLYDGWLARRGEQLAHGADRALMERIRVRDAADRRAATVRPEASLAELVAATGRARQLALPVVDGDGTLFGVIRYADLRTALMDRGELAPLLVAADLAEPTEMAAPSDSLRDALRVMNARAHDALPVVDPASGRYMGLLSRADLLAAYERQLLEEV
jgi:CIC family chloride channel protein